MADGRYHRRRPNIGQAALGALGGGAANFVQMLLQLKLAQREEAREDEQRDRSSSLTAANVLSRVEDPSLIDVLMPLLEQGVDPSRQAPMRQAGKAAEERLTEDRRRQIVERAQQAIEALSGQVESGDVSAGSAADVARVPGSALTDEHGNKKTQGATVRQATASTVEDGLAGGPIATLEDQAAARPVMDRFSRLEGEARKDERRGVDIAAEEAGAKRAAEGEAAIGTERRATEELGELRAEQREREAEAQARGQESVVGPIRDRQAGEEATEDRRAAVRNAFSQGLRFALDSGGESSTLIDASALIASMGDGDSDVSMAERLSKSLKSNNVTEEDKRQIISDTLRFANITLTSQGFDPIPVPSEFKGAGSSGGAPGTGEDRIDELLEKQQEGTASKAEKAELLRLLRQRRDR